MGNKVRQPSIIELREKWSAVLESSEDPVRQLTAAAHYRAIVNLLPDDAGRRKLLKRIDEELIPSLEGIVLGFDLKFCPVAEDDIHDMIRIIGSIKNGYNESILLQHRDGHIITRKNGSIIGVSIYLNQDIHYINLAGKRSIIENAYLLCFVLVPPAPQGFESVFFPSLVRHLHAKHPGQTMYIPLGEKSPLADRKYGLQHLGEKLSPAYVALENITRQVGVEKFLRKLREKSEENYQELMQDAPDLLDKAPLYKLEL